MTTTEDYYNEYSNYSEYYYNGIDAEPCDYYTHSSYFLPVLYSLFFVVGFLGNMLVVWVILRGAQKSMTDVCLLNLAFADLLLIFSLPFLAHYARGTWTFGNVMCGVVLAVYYIGFYGIIFFIVLMSIHTYLNFFHSVFASRNQSMMYWVLFSLVVWIIAIAASFPELLHPGIESYGDKVICSAYPKNSNHNDVRIAALFKMNVLGLLIPLSIVGFCYSMVLRRLRRLQTVHKSKKKAIRLVVVVMVIFFCCWIPYNIAAFLKALELKHILTGCEFSKSIQLMLQVTEAMAYSHSCLNPFLYVFVGGTFRRDLSRKLRQTPHIHVQCLKRYMTETAGTVFSDTTKVEEHSTAP